MRANEFNIGDKIIDNDDNMVIEILDKYSTGNIKYKVLNKGTYKWTDLNVGKIYRGDMRGRWQKLPESIPNIPAKAIQEMRNKISENEKNLADMKKTLEKMEIQNKVSFKVGDMISFMFAEEEFRGVVVNKISEKVVKILHANVNQLVGDWDFAHDAHESITNIKILNSKKQKEMSKIVLDFYNGKIPE